MKKLNYIFVPILASVSLFANNHDTTKQSEDFYKKSLSELLDVETELKADVGSRSGERDLLLSAVPIDVVTSEQIAQSGTSELSQILQRYIPGFNFPRPSISDGTDHSRPFTLRGLNPDQVLVLINGKRLHQSSLLNMNSSVGRGTSSVDLNSIPVAAIERVEVLRDGAAAQYGSDAIAGVINIILKGYGHASKATVTYGETKVGDGVMKRADMFYSIPLDYDGFINITGEFRDRGPTNRAGPDRRTQYPAGDLRNDLPAPINMHYGDADTTDTLLMVNSEVITENGLTFYMHGSYNDRNSESGAFVRRPIDARNNTNIYPDGFLPMIAPEIEDYSFSVGVKDILDNGVKWDLSYTHGYNNYHFYVYNTHNDSLGDTSPTSFDSGGTSYRQEILNLDISKKIDDLHLAAGLEFRKENYQVYQGEEASYILGDVSDNAGAQGFPGFQPSNIVDADRQNYAAYIDATYNFDKNLIVSLASRYEYYNDFGSTLDGKLSVAYKPTPKLLLRTTGSTGFRAPSLSQSHYTSTTTGRSGAYLYETGTFGVDHPLSVALGAVDLKPEESVHFSSGFVYQPISDFSFSADYFYTTIDDRIMLTANIKETISPEIAAILNEYNIGRARYFTNAISTKTEGVDLRLNYKYTFENSSTLKTTFSYQYNNTEITGINTAPSILGDDGQSILVDDLTKSIIVDAQPKDSFKFYTLYTLEDLTTKLNINRFGSYKSMWGDTVYDFDATWTTDVEFSYKINKTFNIAIGSENIFDVYPDKWDDTGSPFAGPDKLIQYSQYSPYGYNGAFYYFRVEMSF